jgi:hypothetical protein
MLAFFAYVLLLTTLAVAQTMEPLAACSESTTSPACVLTFTPWAAGDIGGRSTYYQTIVTEYLNVSFDVKRQRETLLTNADHSMQLVLSDQCREQSHPDCKSSNPTTGAFLLT